MDHLHQSIRPSGECLRIGKHIIFNTRQRSLWHSGSPEKQTHLDPLPAQTLLQLARRPRTILRWDQLSVPEWTAQGQTADAHGVAWIVHAPAQGFSGP